MEKQLCEYCDCENEATIYDDNLDAYLCDEHDGGDINATGYCSRSCLLGYGCDDSC